MDIIFKDREEVAHLLCKKLEKYQGSKPLVLGIPRGAVVMAKIIAESLQGELGVILVHKIPAPFSDELAIASIGLSGVIDRLPLIESLNISESYLKTAAEAQLEVLKARNKKYGLKEPNYKDRTVIIVDDGIATGATVIAAIREVRHSQPNKIIVASGVAAPDSAKKIRKLADELVLLLEPTHFYAVGQFFQNFPQVDDKEVITMLKNSDKNQ